MSLTCHEEIGRVTRVGRGCYEDASNLSATSRACRARGIWRTTRHTDKRATLNTAADHRPTSQVSARGKLSGEVVRHARMSHEDATGKLIAWNSSCNRQSGVCMCAGVRTEHVQRGAWLVRSVRVVVGHAHSDHCVIQRWSDSGQLVSISRFVDDPRAR